MLCIFTARVRVGRGKALKKALVEKRMLSLTTWQRDLLHYLINKSEPVDTLAYGSQQHLTPRQIRYGLREIESWLERRQVRLVNTPKSGLQVVITPEQREKLLAELSSQTKFQLILTSEQRQQLLLCLLLVAQEPLTLQQLQQDLVISRMTVLKDLDAIEGWLQNFALELARRTHVGCWIEGGELDRRQALMALLWGDVHYDQPIMSVQPPQGIIFALAQDTALLPVVVQVNALVDGWNLESMKPHIAGAEKELGIRFTDEAFSLLCLALAVQLERVRAGQLVEWQTDESSWIETQGVWPVLQRVGGELWPHLAEEKTNSETAALALQFLGSARDVPWPPKLRVDPTFHRLIKRLMKSIAAAYGMPDLAHDQMLYDGLDILVMPAYARQRFGLWSPRNTATDTYGERYNVERKVAVRVAEDVMGATGIPLQPAALDDLVLLLQAAIIRAKPERSRHILVVCPSGIATTQLLVARLRARFLSMGTFEVLPIRELSAERIAQADLLITTVPLSLPENQPIDVIQVHPLLKSEDIAALTQWMA